MVRYYRYPYARPRRTYRQTTLGRPFTKRSRANKLPSMSVIQTVEANVNDGARLQFIQGVLDTHAPGATASWRAIAYLVMSGDDIKGLFTNAFMNLDGVHLKGLKVLGFHPTGGTMIIGYRQDPNDQLRVISGTGRVKAGFMFKDGRLPSTLVLISQSSVTFKLRVSYQNSLVKSLL